MNKYQESLNYIIDNYIDMHYEGQAMNEDTEHAIIKNLNLIIPCTVLYVVYAVIVYATLYGLNAPSGNPLESGF